MEYRKTLFMNKTILMIILVFLSGTAAIAFGKRMIKDSAGPQIVNQNAEVPRTDTIKDTPSPENKLSKVILTVSEMSCSGCISTIKSSLAHLNGIKDILVDIRRQRAEVYFDSKILKNVSEIADAITKAGYPALVQRIISAEELKNETNLATTKSRYYIASVGGYDIARNDFETELSIAKKRYSRAYGKDLFASTRGKALYSKLQSQIASKLVDEGVIMQEIVKSDFKTDNKTVEEELEKYLAKIGKDLEEFRKSLNEMGYDFNYFMKKFERKVLINKYLNDRILADASNPVEKKSMLNSWFSNSKVLAEVVYYDRNIENLVRNQRASSGCGSSCSSAKR